MEMVVARNASRADDVSMAGLRRKGAKRGKRASIEPYDIRFTVTRSLGPCSEPEEYLVHIQAEIVQVTEDGKTPVGNVDAYVVAADRAMDEGEDIRLVCDDIGDGLEDLCGLVFDGSGSLSEGVGDGCAGNDVLFLRQATVHRDHRGQRIGLAAVLRVIEDFGRGCAVAVMKPFPLQLSTGRDRSVDVEGFEPDDALARAKLERHWEKLGFTRLNDSALFVLDLQAQRPGFLDLFSD